MIVFFNPLDTSCIRAWANDEVGTFRFLCTAYPQRISDIPADRSAISEDNKRRRDLIRNRVRDVQKEGQAVVRRLEEEETQRDIKAQETSLPDESATIDSPKNTDLAAGLLSSSRLERLLTAAQIAAYFGSGDTLLSLPEGIDNLLVGEGRFLHRLVIL